MADHTESLVMEEFMKSCRAHGLKVTPQRLAIYRLLKGSGEHPSADAVYRRIHELYPSISFDTVNRTLLTFVDMGVIDTVESHQGVRRYDTDTSTHHHLHCVKCGKIVDFYDAGIDDIEIPEEVTKGFTILGKRVVISGICPECASKMQHHEKR